MADHFQRIQRKHAKCKYNIVYDPSEHYFPGVSAVKPASGCLRHRGTDGSNLLLQPRSELRSDPIAALLLGRIGDSSSCLLGNLFCQNAVPKVSNCAAQEPENTANHVTWRRIESS